MILSNRYNNHHTSDPYLSSIHDKSATNIQKLYSIALPSWKLWFVSGLFLAALGYATRKQKGDIKGIQVNDPSALFLGTNESGVLNSLIDRQDPIAIPPVHYQSALQRLWQRLYNLRLNHPEEDIIIYKDDLLSAFRRIFYHPDSAVTYNFFFGASLVIPVGMVFGSRDAPFLFCLLYQLRSFTSWFVHRLPLSRPTTSKIDWFNFLHDPSYSRDIKPAHKYPMKQGVDSTELICSSSRWDFYFHYYVLTI